MMRLAKLTQLLAAFSLLTSAATANAECAWVLWGESTGPLMYETAEYVISASDSKQACEQARDKQIAQIVRLKPKNA